jgi:acyl-CoA dehydrogenase
VQAIAGRKTHSFGLTALRLQEALDSFERTTHFMLNMLKEVRIDDVLAGATPYLRLFALTLSGIHLAKAALGEADMDDGHTINHHILCRFFAKNILPETLALEKVVTTGFAFNRYDLTQE